MKPFPLLLHIIQTTFLFFDVDGDPKNILFHHILPILYIRVFLDGDEIYPVLFAADFRSNFAYSRFDQFCVFFYSPFLMN